MVMRVGNSGGSRVAGPAGPPARLRNRRTPVNGCPQRIPDRHSEDLFVGVASKGLSVSQRSPLPDRDCDPTALVSIPNSSVRFDDVVERVNRPHDR